MPELPEVETIRSQLARVIVGLTILNIEVRYGRKVQGNLKLLIGKKIKAVRRFGKLLVIDFSHDFSLAVHVKMTGRLVYKKNQDPLQLRSGQARTKNQTYSEIDYERDKHTHVVLTFANGSKLYYNDVRKFGWLTILPTGKVPELPFIKNLGPEFLRDLTKSKFLRLFKELRKPIKLVLMDQSKLSGVGNIYANEALWCAGIYPQAVASTLGHASAALLFDCLEKILKQAIKWKGASQNNYRDAFGEKGEVQEHFQVYDREGKPCLRCKTLIKKIQLGGRGTFFCPKCQKKS